MFCAAHGPCRFVKLMRSVRELGTLLAGIAMSPSWMKRLAVCAMTVPFSVAAPAGGLRRFRFLDQPIAAAPAAAGAVFLEARAVPVAVRALLVPVRLGPIAEN